MLKKLRLRQIYIYMYIHTLIEILQKSGNFGGTEKSGTNLK